MEQPKIESKAACELIAVTEGLEQIKSVIDRVLWTAGATESNKCLLAEAIAEELGNVVEKEREACALSVEAVTPAGQEDWDGTLAYKRAISDAAKAIRRRTPRKSV